MIPKTGPLRRFIILVLLSFAAFQGKAQSNLVLYHITDEFNSSNFNPAFLTSQENFTFSIFPLSGMSVGYNSQDVVRDMLFKILRGDSLRGTMSDVFNRLIERGTFYQRFETNLISFGVNSRIGNFNFRIKEVEQLMSNLKGNVGDFITNPGYNTLFVNQPQKFPINMSYYREYSLGYAREIIPDKLSIGIRAKLYFGKIAAKSAVQAEMVNENGEFHFKTSGPVYLSIPLDLTLDPDSIPNGGTLAKDFSAGKFLFNSKNLGAGIDLGITYRINPALVLSASVTDLGKINWKSNLNTINYKGNYLFPEEFTDKTGADYLTKKPTYIADTSTGINRLFKASFSKEPFARQLPAVFYAGLHYNLNASWNLGFVERYIYSKGMSFNAVSFTGTYQARKNLVINTGYSVIGNSFFNIPLGIVRTGERAQFYIATDNLLSFFLPNIPEYSGITFGTCFYLFRQKAKYLKQLEYLPFYRERKSKLNKTKGITF